MTRHEVALKIWGCSWRGWHKKPVIWQNLQQLGQKSFRVVWSVWHTISVCYDIELKYANKNWHVSQAVNWIKALKAPCTFPEVKRTSLYTLLLIRCLFEFLR
jgi:hypothetical protein